jgi:hypothetical protein
MCGFEKHEPSHCCELSQVRPESYCDLNEIHVHKVSKNKHSTVVTHNKTDIASRVSLQKVDCRSPTIKK